MFLLILGKGGNMNKTRISIDNRINLQAGIEKGLSLKRLINLLKKNRSSIYREIHNYSYDKRNDKGGCRYCSKREFCEDNGVITEFQNWRKCKDFKKIECSKLKRFPYVCNGCQRVDHCSYDKRYYDCAKAHTLSLRNRILTRKGMRIPQKQINMINKIVSPLIRKGQSIHHIFVTSPTLKTMVCERTIRRLIYNNFLDIKAIDLPRYARFRHVQKTYQEKKNKIANIERLFERTFTEYKKFTKANPELSIVQFDSVIGKACDKRAILTITFPKERFQFGRLIYKSNPNSVNRAIRHIFKMLGPEKTKEVFAVNLADNGREFVKFHMLECHDVRVYFTNPYRSTDKAACERNHEFIRYVIPKGISLDDLTQRKLNLLFSHINSYVRESNENKTPFELIEKRFGSEFLKIIGIRKVHPKNIFLKPELLQ